MGKETVKELAEEEPEHRHISHCYALYPGNMVDYDSAPELMEAFRKTLVKRGDEGTEIMPSACLQDSCAMFLHPLRLWERSRRNGRTMISSTTTAEEPTLICSMPIRPSRSMEISVLQQESRK